MLITAKVRIKKFKTLLNPYIALDFSFKELLTNKFASFEKCITTSKVLPLLLLADVVRVTVQVTYPGSKKPGIKNIMKIHL